MDNFNKILHKIIAIVLIVFFIFFIKECFNSEDNRNTILGSMLIALLILLGIVYLIRELVCWYNKVNERIENQKKIIDLLTLNNEILERIESNIKKEE